MPLAKHPSESNAAPPVLVEVWTWGLDVGRRELDELSRLLSGEEQQRASRFVRPTDRQRWVAAHGGMRRILGQTLQSDPAELLFATEAFGRPTLASRDAGFLSFNLSHAENVGALAVSRDAVVGVDIEVVRCLAGDEMAAALADEELELIQALHGEAQLQSFFRLWTLKEAFTKALGTGLSTPLSSFAMDAAPGSEPVLSRWDACPEGAGQWRFALSEPAPKLVVAIAAQAAGRDLRVVWRDKAESLPGN